MRVAVVHNSNHQGVVCQYGQPSPEHYSLRTIEAVIAALTAAGHTVASLEGDKTLLAQLEQFLAPVPGGQPSGLVFNMAYGIQGENRYTHVPAMLEMAGIPYTGSTPLGHALALDKVITKILLLEAGLPTPAFRVMRTGDEDVAGLRFPLVVKPRHESTSFGLSLVHTPEELRPAVQLVTQQYEQDALVEEFIAGREITIGLLGSSEVEFLPAVELDFAGRELALNTLDDKSHRRLDEPRKVCPAQLEPALLEHLQRLALGTFRACHLRDYARVDMRLDTAGNPFILEVNSMASLGEGGSFVTAAKEAGYTFNTLVQRIAEVARSRSLQPVASEPAQETAGPLAAAVG